MTGAEKASASFAVAPGGGMLRLPRELSRLSPAAACRKSWRSRQPRRLQPAGVLPIAPTAATVPSAEIVAVVLAGGHSRRMGGRDKFMLPLAGRTILTRVLDRIAPQVGEVVLTTNGPTERIAGVGVPMVNDLGEVYRGPLAGLLTGMRWTSANRPQARWVLSVPADTPFLPADLVPRLAAALAGSAEAACVRSEGRLHPVVALLPLCRADALEAHLATTMRRRVDGWLATLQLAVVDFAAEPIDPFFNVNTPEDFARAEVLAGMAP